MQIRQNIAGYALATLITNAGRQRGGLFAVSQPARQIVLKKPGQTPHGKIRWFNAQQAMLAAERNTLIKIPVSAHHPALQIIRISQAAERFGFKLGNSGSTRGGQRIAVSFLAGLDLAQRK